MGKEQPFERGITCSARSIDHEATTSISGGSSRMIVKEYGICPNCGTQLEWKEDEVYFPPKPEQNVMREGNIKCDCGQEFYYETKRLIINCIKCGKEHSVV